MVLITPSRKMFHTIDAISCYMTDSRETYPRFHLSLLHQDFGCIQGLKNVWGQNNIAVDIPIVVARYKMHGPIVHVSNQGHIILVNTTSSDKSRNTHSLLQNRFPDDYRVRRPRECLCKRQHGNCRSAETAQTCGVYS